MIEPQEIDWAPDQVGRFWDYYSSNPAFNGTYFAGIIGRDLIRYASRRVKVGRALDVGCGRGDLLAFLLGRGYPATGVEQSVASVDTVNGRFAGAPQFGGAHLSTTSLPDGSADTVFMVDVIEHVDDQALTGILSEVRRVLTPGGHIVLTTPNDENLEISKRMCPNCGTVFHGMQHVRSWSASSLSDHMGQAGFACISAEATLLTRRTGLGKLAHLLFYKAKRSPMPHLIYIGRKIS